MSNDTYKVYIVTLDAGTLECCPEVCTFTITNAINKDEAIVAAKRRNGNRGKVVSVVEEVRKIRKI